MLITKWRIFFQQNRNGKSLCNMASRLFTQAAERTTVGETQGMISEISKFGI